MKQNARNLSKASAHFGTKGFGRTGTIHGNVHHMANPQRLIVRAEVIVEMKSRNAILGTRWIRPFAHLFSHPALWRLSRRSVPRALALGLFAAFILPVGQFLLAALLAVPSRANVPLAAAATLVTNPVTFPAIYYGAYKVGALLLRHTPGGTTGELATSFGSAVLEVSGPTALGLMVFAVVAAALGYAVGTIWWRVRLMRLWAHKTLPRKERSKLF